MLTHFLRSLLLMVQLHLPGPRKLLILSLDGVTLELNRRTEKKKRIRRTQIKIPVVRKQWRSSGYRSTRARDARFSSQRSLRRMFRNS
jgi:hypothetical protein